MGKSWGGERDGRSVSASRGGTQRGGESYACVGWYWVFPGPKPRAMRKTWPGLGQVLKGTGANGGLGRFCRNIALSGRCWGQGEGVGVMRKRQAKSLGPRRFRGSQKSEPEAERARCRVYLWEGARGQGWSGPHRLSRFLLVCL